MSVDATGQNSQTGANSTNQNGANISWDQTVTTTNDSNVSNTFNFTADTGNNTVANNTSVGATQTGDASLDLTLHTDAQNGTSSVTVSGTGGDVTVSSTNTGTGSGSTNTNTTTVHTTLTKTVTNTANVSNTVSATMNTGGNTVAGNTLAGGLTTGSVHFSVNVANVVNGPVPVTPVVPVTPQTPGGTGGGEEYNGMGGDFLPLPTLTTPVVLASVAQPVPTGVGGGFFAAGSGLAGTQMSAMVLLAAVAVYGSSILSKKLNPAIRLTHFWGTGS